MYAILYTNEYVKDSLDKLIIKKNITKKKFTFDEKRKLLFEFCDNNNELPKIETNYKDFRIGVWFFNTKKKIINNNCDLYKVFAINQFIKKELDRYLENKDINKDNKRLDFNSMSKLLFDFCNINNKLPTHICKQNGESLGIWYQNQKSRMINKESINYKLLSENIIIKNDLEKFLENKNNKKRRLTFDEGKEILFNYCNTHKSVPSKNVVFNDRKPGCWFQQQKKKINSVKSKEYISLSQNPCVKISLDKYLANKN